MPSVRVCVYKTRLVAINNDALKCVVTAVVFVYELRTTFKQYYYHTAKKLSAIRITDQNKNPLASLSE